VDGQTVLEFTMDQYRVLHLMDFLKTNRGENPGFLFICDRCGFMQTPSEIAYEHVYTERVDWYENPSSIREVYGEETIPCSNPMAQIVLVHQQ
jgi:hypothetical protein